MPQRITITNPAYAGIAGRTFQYDIPEVGEFFRAGGKGDVNPLIGVRTEQGIYYLQPFNLPTGVTATQRQQLMEILGQAGVSPNQLPIYNSADIDHAIREGQITGREYTGELTPDALTSLISQFKTRTFGTPKTPTETLLTPGAKTYTEVPGYGQQPTVQPLAAGAVAGAAVSAVSGQYNHPAIKSRDLIIAGGIINVPGLENASYRIKTGDTLTSIAKKYGTTIDAILLANNLTPTPSAIVSTTTPPIVGTSAGATISPPATPADDLKKLLSDISLKTAQADSLTLDQRISQLKASLAGTTPAVPTLLSDYQAMRSTQGLPDLENQINTIKSQIRDLDTSYRTSIGTMVRGGPMELRSAKQQELYNQYQTDLGNLQNRQQTLVDEYNTKLSTIQTAMNFKQWDYNQAQQDYNTKFNQTLQIYELISKETEDQKNIAKSNLSVISNYIEEGIKGGTIDFNNIDATTQSLISKLELQAGYTPGLTMALIKVIKPEKEILTHITSDDNTQVSVIYKNGTVETFNTGLLAKAEKSAKLSYEFSNEDRGMLISIGNLTNQEIDVLESDINSYGLETALKNSELDPDQESIIKDIISGKTPIQIRTETTGEMFLSNQQITDISRSLMKQYGNTTDAKNSISGGKIMINKKEIDLSKSQIKTIQDKIDTEYPSGKRSFWQRLFPGGR